MPVNDQWKLKETKGPAAAAVTPSRTISTGGGVSAQFGPRVGGSAVGKASNPVSPTTVGDNSAPSTPVAMETNSDSGQQSTTAQNSGATRTTKNLAGFWSTQNDEVKVRKKRLVAMDSTGSADVVPVATDDVVAISPTSSVAIVPAGGSFVVENVPQRQAEGVARAEDPGEWQKPIPIEPGRIKNVANTFQQPKTEPDNRAPSENTRRPTSKVSDRWSVQSYESSRSSTSTAPLSSPDDVLNRKTDTIVLAENQPVELGADVVKSEGSSWDDVAELEAGRTKNLLARWKATEQESAVPKTSTSRYDRGSKPAWILEIEAAKETTSGAIGSTWTGNSPGSDSDDKQSKAFTEITSSPAGSNTATSDHTTQLNNKSKEKEIVAGSDARETVAENRKSFNKPEAEAVVSLPELDHWSPNAAESTYVEASQTFTTQHESPPDSRNSFYATANADAYESYREATPPFADAVQNFSPTTTDVAYNSTGGFVLAVENEQQQQQQQQQETTDIIHSAQTEAAQAENVANSLVHLSEPSLATLTDLGFTSVSDNSGNLKYEHTWPTVESSSTDVPLEKPSASFTLKTDDDDFAASVLQAVTSLQRNESVQQPPDQQIVPTAVNESESVPHTDVAETFRVETTSSDDDYQQADAMPLDERLVADDYVTKEVEQRHQRHIDERQELGAVASVAVAADKPLTSIDDKRTETDQKQRLAKKTKDKDDKRKSTATDAEKRLCAIM